MTAAATDVLTDRYTRHLATHGLTSAQVLAQVDESFGEPLLVVAAGSVIAGFGNASSDLDLYVVVPDEVASTLPLMAYPEGARIDVILHGVEQVRTRHREVVAGAWPPPAIGPGDLVARRKVLDSLSRFGLGLPLVGVDDWRTWQRELDGQVTEWLRSWYAAEAVRKRLAARVVAAHKPMVAAIRAGEALIAALERHAVTEGERYFKWKWLGEKLRRLDDRSGLAAFEHAACPPLTAAEVPAYLAKAEGLLDQYLSDVDTSTWRAVLTHGVGTIGDPFGESHLVSRWGLRAVSVPATSPVAKADAWEYHLDEPWHPDVAALFAEDLLWLGIREAS